MDLRGNTINGQLPNSYLLDLRCFAIFIGHKKGEQKLFWKQSKGCPEAHSKQHRHHKHIFFSKAIRCNTPINNGIWWYLFKYVCICLFCIKHDFLAIYSSFKCMEKPPTTTRVSAREKHGQLPPAISFSDWLRMGFFVIIIFGQSEIITISYIVHHGYYTDIAGILYLVKSTNSTTSVSARQWSAPCLNGLAGPWCRSCSRCPRGELHQPVNSGSSGAKTWVIWSTGSCQAITEQANPGYKDQARLVPVKRFFYPCPAKCSKNSRTWHHSRRYLEAPHTTTAASHLGEGIYNQNSSGLYSLEIGLSINGGNGGFIMEIPFNMDNGYGYFYGLETSKWQ